MSDKNKILSEFKSKTKSIMGNSLKQIILYGSYAEVIIKIIPIWT